MLRKNPWLNTLVQILGWLLFLSLPWLMRPSAQHKAAEAANHLRERPDEYLFTLMHILQNALLIPLFYLNVVIIRPLLFTKKKAGLFFAAQAGFIALLVLANRLLSWAIFDDISRPFPWMFLIINYLFITSLAYAYTSVSENIEREKREKDRENSTLQAELTFLRWQVSPHFLFNVLNNLVALARKQSANLEPMLLELSTLMRYMLYETNGKKIRMEQEASYLHSYIHLQSLRFGNEVTISTAIEVPEGSSDAIEPMLLIPFVENAFKHGTGLIPEPVIETTLRCSKGHLVFLVKNKYAPELKTAKDDSHGIGLANVQRRLNLLYPSKHQLQTDIGNGWYITTLNIDLS